jgi:hypothetical protein
MRPGRIRAGVVGTAAAVVVGCAGCAPAVEEAGPPPVDPLTSMLLSETEVNAIVAPAALTTTFSYRTLFELRAGKAYAPTECLAVEANTMTEVYDGSEFRAVRGVVLDADDESADLDQGVIQFDNPAAANAFVDRTVATWQRCAGGVLTVTDEDPEPWLLSMDEPERDDGVELVRVRSDTGYVSTHAMRVVGDVVVDVRASHRGVSEHAVALVNAISGRSSL